MLPPDVPVYVAAEPWNDTRFGPVKRRFPNVRWLTAVVADVLPGLPPAFAGPIEQARSVTTRPSLCTHGHVHQGATGCRRRSPAPSSRRAATFAPSLDNVIRITVAS